MNAYGFAGGDRINFSDPMGLSPCCIELAGVMQGIADGSKAMADANKPEVVKLGMPDWLTGPAGGEAKLFSIAENKAMQKLFGSGVKGAMSRLENMHIPEGLNAETLERYAEKVARPILETASSKSTEAARAVQGLRLRIIDEALKVLKK